MTEKTIEKECSIRREPCIKERCEQFIQIIQVETVLGVKVQKAKRMCCFVAQCLISSSQPMPISKIPVKFNGGGK